jgi:NADH:ubiquinone oxidoreductase subunit 5 (subunit L)/multisubunit Na+/H+ antiporter MnhA subunit
MDRENGGLVFVAVMLTFMGRMIIFLTREIMRLVVRWERIRLMSFLLIGF